MFKNILKILLYSLVLSSPFSSISCRCPFQFPLPFSSSSFFFPFYLFSISQRLKCLRWSILIPLSFFQLQLSRLLLSNLFFQRLHNYLFIIPSFQFSLYMPSPFSPCFLILISPIELLVLCNCLLTCPHWMSDTETLNMFI